MKDLRAAGTTRKWPPPMNDAVKARNDRDRRVLEKGLDQYFSAYDSSQALAAELVKRRQYPIDVLILLCARLDALASDALGDNTPHKQAFCRFVTNYGGHRELFEAVSVPDLYYEIGYHRWKLSGTIPAPGRLNRVSELDDPFFHLVEDSGLPITLKEIGRLLDTVTRILERAFRAKARQASSKSRISSASALKNVIEDAAKKSRLRQIASRLPQALLPLMNKTSMSNILYERFRCEAIHGASVRIDANRFFSEFEVYWKRIYPIYQGRTYELVEFPAAFLLECLKACIGAYRTHLLAKGNVPHAIYFRGFEDLLSTVHFLDSESMPEGGAVRLRLPK